MEEDELDENIAEGPRSFAHHIHGMSKGSVNSACSTELHDLLLFLRSEAVARRDKVKGKFILTLDIAVNDDDVVAIDHSIKVKAPEPRRPGEVMWLTAGGNLSPSNPRQADLPGLREVSGGRIENRDVTHERANREA